MFNYFKWNILKLVFTYYHFEPTTNQRLFDKKAILKLQNYIFTKINLVTTRLKSCPKTIQPYSYRKP